MLIGAPDARGVVHVRSWTADDWSAPPQSARERADDAARSGSRRRRSAGRSMNQSLYAVRLWLRGEGERTA